MKTATHRYLGNLRTLMRHERSGQEVVTDAPVDNNGKGEAFSPTDMLASSLVSCMITVMGIRAEKGGIHMGDVSGSVVKIMADNPRRVSGLQLELHFSNHALTDLEKDILQRTALSCPVALSLHRDIRQEVTFHW